VFLVDLVAANVPLVAPLLSAL